MLRKPKRIEVRSLVSHRNLEPYVDLLLINDDGTEERITQWTPEDAYHHAMAVIACVEAANTDAFFLDFLVSRMGVKLEDAGVAIAEFRLWRERRRPPEATQ